MSSRAPNHERGGAHRQRGVSRGASSGVFSLISVVIQRSAEEAWLDGGTLAANQMLPAVTLAVLHHTPSNPISRRVKRAKTLAPGASILSDLPVIVGTAKVAVTWSAAP